VLLALLGLHRQDRKNSLETQIPRAVATAMAFHMCRWELLPPDYLT